MALPRLICIGKYPVRVIATMATSAAVKVYNISSLSAHMPYANSPYAMHAPFKPFGLCPNGSAYDTCVCAWQLTFMLEPVHVYQRTLYLSTL